MIAPIKGELFISNIDGSQCAAEIWRRLRIDESRDRVRELRERHRLGLLFRDVARLTFDPLMPLVEQEYINICLYEADAMHRTTRMAWYLAYHRVRFNRRNHTRTDHD